VKELGATYRGEIDVHVVDVIDIVL